MNYLYSFRIRLFLSVFLSLYFISRISAQEVSWQRSIGGKQGEYLFDALPTPDYGFILAGSSVSEVSGNKQQENKGSLDYFLWKLNEQGNEEWQKSFGGNQADFLYSVRLTQDGGYILGGSSYSGISGDKRDSCRGLDDYWILKLNARGEEQWQKTLGGSGSDLLKSVKEVPGGYILAGFSNSPACEDKSEDSYGGNDYWMVKLDINGKVLWERVYGGKGNDELSDMIVTRDGGFLLAGSSDSPQEGIVSFPTN